MAEAPKVRKEKITFYYETKNVSKLKQEEKSLKNILQQHIKPKNKELDINVNVYYKSKKLSTNFSTRSRNSTNSQSHVVYQFSCPERDCKSRYIGYTTNTVHTRAVQHRYKPSKIHTHLSTEHNKPTIGNIEDNFKILFSSSNLNELKIAEALLIKLHLPEINIKYNEISNILSIF